MHPVLIDVYKDMVARFGCSAEDDPNLRETFLTEWRQALIGEWSERELLSRLSNF